MLPWLGALGAADEPRAHGNVGADADASLPPLGRRPVVRDARVPGTGACLSRRGHGRGDERDAADRHGVAGREGAATAAAGGDRAHAAALDGGARDVRGRLLPHRTRDGVRPARRSRFPSSSPPPARSPRSSPDASATASSARAASSPSSTGSCSPPSTEGAGAAGRDPRTIVRMIEIKVSYDHDADYARDACRWWAALSLTPEEKMGVEDPVEMERLADAAADRAHSRFIVSADPEQVAAQIAPYTELGFTHLVFHAPGRGPAPLPRPVLRGRRAAARASSKARASPGRRGPRASSAGALRTSRPREHRRRGSPSGPGRA